MAAVQGYDCISSVYISFQVLWHIAFRRIPASMLGSLVVMSSLNRADGSGFIIASATILLVSQKKQFNNIALNRLRR